MSTQYCRDGVIRLMAAMCDVSPEAVQRVVSTEETWQQLAEATQSTVNLYDERTRFIFEAYYALCGDGPRTLKELGGKLRISKSRVQQLRNQALFAIGHQQPAFYALATRLQATGHRSHGIEIILKHGISYDVQYLRSHFRWLVETDRSAALQTTFRALPLSGRVCEQLAAAGIRTVADVCTHTRGQLLEKTALPKKDFDSIEAALDTYELRLKKSSEKSRRR